MIPLTTEQINIIQECFDRLLSNGMTIGMSKQTLEIEDKAIGIYSYTFEIIAKEVE